MIVNPQAIQKRVSMKKERLKAQCQTQYPKSVSLVEAHERKIRNAKNFLKELENLEKRIGPGEPIALASSFDEFEKKYYNASRRTASFYGKWCMLARISEDRNSSETGAGITLLYMASLESL